VSAWLGVPCLILRTTTEWVEMVGASGGSAVLIGLDREVAVRELEVRAPHVRGIKQAVERAADLALTGSGAAERIADALTLATTGGRR